MSTTWRNVYTEFNDKPGSTFKLMGEEILSLRSQLAEQPTVDYLVAMLNTNLSAFAGKSALDILKEKDNGKEWVAGTLRRMYGNAREEVTELRSQLEAVTEERNEAMTEASHNLKCAQNYKEELAQATKERDEARVLHEQLLGRKLDWSKMNESAFNEVEERLAEARASNAALRSALENIEFINKNMPQTDMPDFQIRNKMEDVAMKALSQTPSTDLVAKLVSSLVRISSEKESVESQWTRRTQSTLWRAQ